MFHVWDNIQTFCILRNRTEASIFNALPLNIFSFIEYVSGYRQMDIGRDWQTDRQMTTRPTDARLDGRTGIPFYRDLKTDDFPIVLANLP